MIGATRLPYALSLLHSTILPSIYVDVQVVLASPVARSAAPYIERNGLPMMASALGAGIFAGYVFVIPGLAAISIAGLLGVPLGRWLLFGIVIGPVTAIVTTIIMRLLLRGRLWKPESDEDVDEAMAEQEAHELAVARAEAGTVGGEAGCVVWARRVLVAPRRVPPPCRGGCRRPYGCPDAARSLPLGVLLLPILVPLLMIAFGAFAELLEFSNSFIAFLGNANLALFVGLLGAYLIFRATAGLESTRETMDEGFHTTGEILLITGVGGSLGAVIGETDLDDGAWRPLFGRGRRTRARDHPAGMVHRSSAAPGDRLGVGRRHHRGRHHRTDPRLHQCGPGRHRTCHRVGRTVRAPGQQQLLLDVQGSAWPVHQRQPQDPDGGHLGRLSGVAANGHRRVADRLNPIPTPTCRWDRVSPQAQVPGTPRSAHRAAGRANSPRCDRPGLRRNARPFPWPSKTGTMARFGMINGS